VNLCPVVSYHNNLLFAFLTDQSNYLIRLVFRKRDIVAQYDMTDANKPNPFYYSMSGNREEDEVSFRFIPFFFLILDIDVIGIDCAHFMNEIVNMSV